MVRAHILRIQQAGEIYVHFYKIRTKNYPKK